MDIGETAYNPGILNSIIMIIFVLYGSIYNTAISFIILLQEHLLK